MEITLREKIYKVRRHQHPALCEVDCDGVHVGGFVRSIDQNGVKHIAVDPKGAYDELFPIAQMYFEAFDAKQG